VAILSLSNRGAVLRAVSEYDALGRDAFLDKYKFGKAREYFLLLNGKRYDSKAVAGVAHGYEHPDAEPLQASDFSGGEQTVRRVLENLGFTVVKTSNRFKGPSALVLVENEVTVGGKYDFWADATGARYQFPNQYRNRICPGLPFVYYRGVRRIGGQRGVAEYFGTGIIGDVWPDSEQPLDTPVRNRRWYCAIEQYTSFSVPVPAKHNGSPFENITSSMGWRTGVREISTGVLDAILEVAGAKAGSAQAKARTSVADAHVSQSEPSDLLITRPRSRVTGFPQGARQLARELREIGNWAEELVYRWLFDTLGTTERDTLDWVAQRGEAPGWDIAYTSEVGSQMYVEVKATTLARFSAIEVTSNEWRAAERYGDNYILALVTRAMSGQPHVALLRNPSKHAADGNITVEPTSFRNHIDRRACSLRYDAQHHSHCVLAEWSRTTKQMKVWRWRDVRLLTDARLFSLCMLTVRGGEHAKKSS